MWQLSWVADYPGRNDFLGVLLGTGSTNNYGRWSSAEFDAAIADAGATTDEAGGGGRHDRAEDIVQRDAPAVPVTYGTGWALARQGLLGAGRTASGRSASRAWHGTSHDTAAPSQEARPIGGAVVSSAGSAPPSRLSRRSPPWPGRRACRQPGPCRGARFGTPTIDGTFGQGIDLRNRSRSTRRRPASRCYSRTARARWSWRSRHRHRPAPRPCATRSAWLPTATSSRTRRSRRAGGSPRRVVPRPWALKSTRSTATSASVADRPRRHRSRALVRGRRGVRPARPGDRRTGRRGNIRAARRDGDGPDRLLRHADQARSTMPLARHPRERGWPGERRDPHAIRADHAERDRRPVGRRGRAHELVHLVFDTAVTNPYHFPPRWLNEGLAVYLSEGYKASDRAAVESAARDGLFPLDGLVGQFPTATASSSPTPRASRRRLPHPDPRPGRARRASSGRTPTG